MFWDRDESLKRATNATKAPSFQDATLTLRWGVERIWEKKKWVEVPHTYTLVDIS